MNSIVNLTVKRAGNRGLINWVRSGSSRSSNRCRCRMGRSRIVASRELVDLLVYSLGGNVRKGARGTYSSIWLNTLAGTELTNSRSCARNIFVAGSIERNSC